MYFITLQYNNTNEVGIKHNVSKNDDNNMPKLHDNRFFFSLKVTKCVVSSE